MKYSAIKNMNYSRIARILKISLTPVSNVLIALDKSVISQLYRESLDKLNELSEESNMSEDLGNAFVIYLNRISFTPHNPIAQFVISLATNQNYTNGVIVLELSEGYSSLEDDLETYGNGSPALLPDNFESLMIDNLMGGDSYMNMQFDKENPPEALSEEELQEKRQFNDPRGGLPRFIGSKPRKAALTYKQTYLVGIPGAPDPVELTYLGRFPDMDFTCSLCGKEGASHEFVEGDPENPMGAWHFGSRCLKKLSIVPSEE